MKRSNLILSKNKILYVLFALIIGVIYIPFISLMPNEWFRDRDNYLIYAQTSDIILGSYNGYLIFFNEPLFLLINKVYSSFFSYYTITYFYSFFFVMVFYLGLVRFSKNSITFILGLLLSLTIPYLLQSELVALRQSVGTALLILGFMLIKNTQKMTFLILICCFIHSIFFIFLLIYVLNFIFLKNTNINKKLIINFVVMFFISIFSIALAKYFGLRQGDEYQQNMITTRGGGAFVLFLFVFLYLYFWGDRKNTQLFDFAMIGLVMFITAYFLTPISGRLFNTVIPFVVYLLVSKGRLQDIFILLSIFLVFLILFINGSYEDLFVISEIDIANNFFQYCQAFFSI